MLSRRCSLCGGKLKGHICTECGLDNSKNDRNYKTHDSHNKYEQLTHVHEKEDPYAGKTMTREQKREMNHVGTYHMNRTSGGKTAGKTAQKKGKAAKIVTVFAILSVLISVAEVAYEAVSDYSYGGYEETDEYEYEYDPYENVTYELPDTGEVYEVTLTPGCYKGGVHIPEGKYEVTLENGAGNLVLEDNENGIYRSTWFDDSENADDTVTCDVDVRIYDGTRITVEENVMLQFWTANAVLPIENMANPNTESVVVTDQFTVGEEVPAGVYDVKCLNGSGIFDYTIEFDDGYSTYEGKLIDAEDSDFPEVFKNVVLPEGTLVIIEDMTVELVPSEIMESEDYLSYYE